MSLPIARNSMRCSASGEKLQPGQSYYSALVDMPQGIHRLDFSATHWSGPPADTLAYWRGRVPEAGHAATPQPISIDQLLEIFESLANADHPLAIGLRHLLTLYLVRRRALRVESTETDADGAAWLVVRRLRDGPVERVLDPNLAPDAMGELEETLQRVLHGEVPNLVLQEPT